MAVIFACIWVQVCIYTSIFHACVSFISYSFHLNPDPVSDVYVDLFLPFKKVLSVCSCRMKVSLYIIINERRKEKYNKTLKEEFRYMFIILQKKCIALPFSSSPATSCICNLCSLYSQCSCN